MSTTARINALWRKETRHIFRDPRTLALVLLMPVLQLVLFGFAVTFDVSSVPTVVVDQDMTTTSRDYVSQYLGSSFFSVTGESPDLSTALDSLRNGDAQVAVVIPPGFADSLARGARGEVAILVDGSDTSAARVADSMAVALNQLYGSRIALSWAESNGIDVSANAAITVNAHTWYNPEKESALFLIPGLMVVIIMIVTVQQTAVTLSRERDLGTAEQLLISPLRAGELMVGKLLPWTILGLADAALIAVLGVVGFGVPMRGSVGVLALGAVLFVVCALGTGLLISAIAPSTDVANILGILLAFLPSFLLSGFAFPLQSIPVVLQWLSCAFPARYMVTISRGVFLKGAGITELWPQLAALGVYALVIVSVAAYAYSRRHR